MINKPIKVALLHVKPIKDFKEGTLNRHGYFAYNVPEFRIDSYPVGRNEELSYKELDGEYDLIVEYNYKIVGATRGVKEVPRFYFSGNTRGGGWPSKFLRNREVSKGFDGVFVNQLSKPHWNDLGIPVISFDYCIDDRLYYDRKLEKTIDISCLMRYHPKHFGHRPRKRLMNWLEDFCNKNGYTCFVGVKKDIEEYAKTFSRSKVTINLTYPFGLNCRVLDSMGAGTCLLSNSLMKGSFLDGIHYVSYGGVSKHASFIPDLDHMGWKLKWLLGSGHWKTVSNFGHKEVFEKHTWPVRAKQVYRELGKVLGGRHN